MKTWWDSVKEDMYSSGLSQEDAYVTDQWRMSTKGQTPFPG